MAVTVLLRALLTALRQSLLLRLQTKLAVVMISRSLTGSWRCRSNSSQRHAGDIATRVSANEQIASPVVQRSCANALDLTSVVFFAIAMAIYDLTLAAICIGLSLVNVMALRSVGERRQIPAESCARTRQAD